jgi:hypothetical protein
MKRRERKRERKRCITGLIDKAIFKMVEYIARSNEILGWEGAGNRQCCAFLKRRLTGAC